LSLDISILTQSQKAQLPNLCSNFATPSPTLVEKKERGILLAIFADEVMIFRQQFFSSSAPKLFKNKLNI